MENVSSILATMRCCSASGGRGNIYCFAFSIVMMPQARQLIERYRSREESSPYLLDILTPTSFDREAFDDYRRCLRKLNFNLSRLPGLMGMEEVKVSSYTARHKWEYYKNSTVYM